MRHEGAMLFPDGDVIRKLRKENGLNQDDFTQRTGLGRRTIQRIEEGKPVRPFTMAVIAKALKVPLKSLIASEKQSGPSTEPKAPLAKYAYDFAVLLRRDSGDPVIGREFVLDAWRGFLHDPQNLSGYFIVEGEPGIGKSTLAWKLAYGPANDVKVCYFNVASRGIVTAQQFLRHVCATLITAYDLSYTTLPEGFDSNGLAMERLLHEASDRLPPGKRLTIVIDALDEAEESETIRSANRLFLPPVLPPRVFIFLTTRRGWEAWLRVESPRVFRLAPDSEGNMLDVTQYIRRRIQNSSSIRRWCREKGLSPSQFIELMRTRSRGNFMYLRYVLPEISRGCYNSTEITAIPDGLANYYWDHWRRMGMMARPRPDDKIRVLYVLSVAAQPVSREMLVDLSGETSATVQELLDEWAPFLHRIVVGEQSRYCLYHESFREFLQQKDILQAAGVSIKRLNQDIADKLLRELSREEK